MGTQHDPKSREFREWTRSVLDSLGEASHSPVRSELHDAAFPVKAFAKSATSLLAGEESPQRMLGAVEAGEILVHQGKGTDEGLDIMDAARIAALRSDERLVARAAELPLALNYHLRGERRGRQSVYDLSVRDFANISARNLEDITEEIEGTLYVDLKDAPRGAERLAMTLAGGNGNGIRTAVTQAILHFPEYLAALEAHQRRHEIAYGLWRSAIIFDEQLTAAMCIPDTAKCIERSRAFGKLPGVAHIWELVPAISYEPDVTIRQRALAIFDGGVTIAEDARREGKIATAATLLANSWQRVGRVFAISPSPEEISTLAKYVINTLYVETETTSRLLRRPPPPGTEEMDVRRWKRSLHASSHGVELAVSKAEDILREAVAADGTKTLLSATIQTVRTAFPEVFTRLDKR